MRHRKHKYRLGVESGHRRSLLKNLSKELIDHGKVKTTHARCMALRSYIEKLVTRAKTDNIANRRIAYSKLGCKTAVNSLFKNVAPKFVERKGGYTRILKLPDGRVGDGAKLSFIAFVE